MSQTKPGPKELQLRADREARAAANTKVKAKTIGKLTTMKVAKKGRRR